LATGLSTAITKDGQTTTTARIPFAQGINSSLATDSSSTSTGSIITAGGVGIAKNLYVGANANIAGTLDVTGAMTVTNPVINNIKMGYTTTATAGGTTTFTAASNYQQFFTGTLTQTIVLPVTSTLALGMSYSIENNSTGTLTVQSSGANTISTIPAGVTTLFTCILITGTTAASWDYDHIGFATITGTGANVLGTSPTITSATLVTPALGTPASGSLVNCTDTNYTGFKNRIINGAMVIDQRNAGASVTPTNGAYTLDRYQSLASQSSKYTIQQNAGSVTPPAGFIKYLGVTSSSAYTVLAADSFAFRQAIEGFNAADLAWGTASAATVTLSFWVRSSLIGTFGGGIVNYAGTRSYPYTYTISAANTWEQKTITIAGDTSGTWGTDNSGWGFIQFGLGVGSTSSGTAGAWVGANYVSATGATSVVGTNGATFYITGVQLEKGSTATSFDYRPYGTELALCQRYYQQWGGEAAVSRVCMGTPRTTAQADVVLSLMTPMRTAPTYSSSGNMALTNAAAGLVAITSYTNDTSTSQNLTFLANVTAGLIAGNATQFVTNNDLTARFKVTAEL
jgi:hypothetical protein